MYEIIKKYKKKYLIPELEKITNISAIETLITPPQNFDFLEINFCFNFPIIKLTFNKNNALLAIYDVSIKTSIYDPFNYGERYNIYFNKKLIDHKKPFEKLFEELEPFLLEYNNIIVIEVPDKQHWNYIETIVTYPQIEEKPDYYIDLFIDKIFKNKQ